MNALHWTVAMLQGNPEMPTPDSLPSSLTLTEQYKIAKVVTDLVTMGSDRSDICCVIGLLKVLSSHACDIQTQLQSTLKVADRMAN